MIWFNSVLFSSVVRFILFLVLVRIALAHLCGMPSNKETEWFYFYIVGFFAAAAAAAAVCFFFKFISLSLSQFGWNEMRKSYGIMRIWEKCNQQTATTHIWTWCVRTNIKHMNENSWLSHSGKSRDVEWYCVEMLNATEAHAISSRSMCFRSTSFMPQKWVHFYHTRVTGIAMW